MTELLSNPIVCDPISFDSLRTLAHCIDHSLFEGTLAICRNWLPALWPRGVEAKLDVIASEVRCRCRGVQPQAMYAHLHDVMFDDRGLICAVPPSLHDILLPTAIDHMRAAPPTFALIYKLVADRLGACAWVHWIDGVGVYVTVVHRYDVLMLDVLSNGRVISVDEIKARVDQADIEWDERMLVPQTNAKWLTSMLQSVIHTSAKAGDYRGVAAALELEMVLWPAEKHLLRDLGLVLARIGKYERQAHALLFRYIRDVPEDPERSDLLNLIAVLER